MVVQVGFRIEPDQALEPQLFYTKNPSTKSAKKHLARNGKINWKSTNVVTLTVS